MAVVAAGARRDPVVAAVGGTPAGIVPDKYSVIVVLIDDIGPEWFDWSGLGGYVTDEDFQTARTPFLSDIATTSGVWLSNHSAESVCSETRVAVNTGLYPHRTGVGFNMRDPGSALGTTYLGFAYATPGSITYLAELLLANVPGLATGCFGKWHMCDGYSAIVANGPDGYAPLTAPDSNLTHYVTQGYQTQAGNLYNVGGAFTWWKSKDGVNSKVGNGATFDETTYPNAVHAADAATWIAARTGPFFAYVAFGPPHAPFTVPPYTMVSDTTKDELVAADLVAGDDLGNTTYQTANMPLVFRAGMEATDTAIARVWAAVPAALKPTTLLFVTGDNGTVANALVPGFTHFKRQLNGGGTLVPMLVRGPMVARPGREIKQVTHVVDLFRTITDVYGITSPFNPTAPVEVAKLTAQDSVSFLRALWDNVDRADVNALRSHILLQNFQPVGTTNTNLWVPSVRQRAVYDGRYRYIRTATTERLYDDVVDFVEATDLMGTGLEAETRLKALMTAELPV